MTEGEELKQELQQKLHWVRYRMQILDIIQKKHIQMREIAVHAKDDTISPAELECLNAKLNHLVAQINALDKESRTIEND